MSHVTRIKTQMAERKYLVQALKDLGYAPHEGSAQIRSSGGQNAAVQVSISTGSRSHNISFQKEGSAYELVADWWGVRGFDREQFVQQLTQRYAYHAARAKLEEQGFDLVTEETQRDGRIHLVLRRVS